jgi:eukaryotic-like serine/threonine-protein kinase
MEAFGPYLLLEKLASGGMAEIFKAKMAGAGGFEKHVAIKKILPEFSADAEFIQMLIDEAKLAARLTHGNIVQVLNLERIGDTWALVLEFVDGIDLFRLQRVLEQHERRLGVDECVHVVREILIALDFVHRATDEEGTPLELVHCDVAPANVMINVGGEVKLIDFGVARVSGLAEIEGRMPGGKIRYRAPEQARGEEFDLRADIYSVAVVLWELLAGERVFESMQLEEMLVRVSSGDVPDIGSIRDDLPDGLIRVLRRALHSDPRYRYPHSAAFLRALEDLEVGVDPARSTHVLSEIVRAIDKDGKAKSRKLGQVTVAEEASLEDALESALEGKEF